MPGVGAMMSMFEFSQWMSKTEFEYVIEDFVIQMETSKEVECSPKGLPPSSDCIPTIALCVAPDSYVAAGRKREARQRWRERKEPWNFAGEKTRLKFSGAYAEARPWRVSFRGFS